jgi:hypothetical protein
MIHEKKLKFWDNSIRKILTADTVRDGIYIEIGQER